MYITSEQILAILQTITIPGDNSNIVSKGYVSSIVIKNQQVGFAITVNNKINQQSLYEECDRKIKAQLPGIEVKIVFTAENALIKSHIQDPRGHPKIRNKLDNIKHVIAISSCKGGVGKSTICVNLAKSLAIEGYKIGLIDADIYGPSIPHMLGVDSRPQLEDNLMLPFTASKIKFISMGNILSKETAAIWRGPMATKTLYKLFYGTKWGELDLLLIDMPPGTGDIYLSLIENYLITGSIIISTPQDIALIDVRKSINMFQKVGIKILGIIENMSYFFEPNLSTKHYIFGQTGGQKLAQEFKIPFLGEIPLDQKIRESADHPTSKNDQAILPYYNPIATQLKSILNL